MKSNVINCVSTVRRCGHSYRYSMDAYLVFINVINKFLSSLNFDLLMNFNRGYWVLTGMIETGRTNDKSVTEILIILENRKYKKQQR